MAFRAAMLVLLLSCLPRPLALAQDAVWTNGGGGLWTDAVSWSPNAAPSNSPNVYITNDVTKTVTVDATTPIGNLVVTDLNVWSVGSATNTLWLSNANPLSVLGNLTVGTNTLGVGALVVDGGQLVTTNSTANAIAYVGKSGAGNATVSNGRWLGNQLVVGYNAGARGTLTLAGGTNIFSSTYYVGNSAGATGVVYLTGGQLVTTNGGGTNVAYVGVNGMGDMTVSGGQWLGNQLVVGQNAGSKGTLTFAGGTSLFTAITNFIGSSAGATGAVWLTGGQLVTTNGARSSISYVGNSGVGAMTVSNGTWLADQIKMGSDGTLNVVGGVITAKNPAGYSLWGAGSVLLDGTGVISNSGSFSVKSLVVSNGVLNVSVLNVGDSFAGTSPASVRLDGGNVAATAILKIGRNAGDVGTVVQTAGLFSSPALSYIGYAGDGTYILSNGTFSVGAMRVASDVATGRGRLNIYGGTNIISGPLNVGAFAGATGSVLVANSGLLEFTTSGAITNGLSTGAGTITNQSGGTIQFDVNPTMVINNGSFVVTNATIAFKGLANAAVTGSITSITVQAGSRLRLDTSTNALVAGFSVGGAGNYAQLELAGVNSLWQSTNLTVAGEGALLGTNGTFALYGNFISQSTNRSQFDLSRSTVLFTNAGAGVTTHILNLTNSAAVDMGLAGLNAVQLATNFSIGTLSLALSNNLTVTGMKSGGTTNALYVGWLDLTAWTTNAASLSTTLSNALTLNDINLYYDAGDARNAYLQDASYNLWGAGLLIPIPEPSTAGILGGVLFSAWLLRRRKE